MASPASTAAGLRHRSSTGVYLRDPARLLKQQQGKHPGAPTVVLRTVSDYAGPQQGRPAGTRQHSGPVSADGLILALQWDDNSLHWRSDRPSWHAVVHGTEGGNSADGGEDAADDLLAQFGSRDRG